MTAINTDATATMRPRARESHTRFHGLRILSVGVLLAWLLTSDRMAQIGPEATIIAFSAIVLVLFVLLSKSFYDRLCWMLALLPLGWRQVPVAGIYISFGDVMLVFLLLESALALRLRNQKFSPMGLLVIGLLAATCISVLTSSVALKILGASTRFGLALSFFVALDRIAFPAQVLREVLRALAYAFPLTLVLLYFNGDLSYIISSVEGGDRPMYSQSLPWLFTLAFPWYLVRIRNSQAVLLLAFIYVLATWLLLSRGMIAAAFLTLMIVVLVRFTVAKSVFLLLAISFALVILGLYRVERIEEGMASLGSRQESNEWRLHKIHLSLQEFEEHPFFGSGPGSEATVSQQKFGVPLASENGFVQVLADFGLVGTILFVSILLYPLARCLSLIRRRLVGRDEAGALMIILLAVVFSLLIGNTSEQLITWLLLAIVCKHVAVAMSNGPAFPKNSP